MSNNSLFETDKKKIFYPNISNVASTAECTGMMRAPANDEEEFDAYQDLSSTSIPKLSNTDLRPNVKKVPQ